MTLYRYAYDDAGTLVDVLEVSAEHIQLGYSYTCIGCGQPLIAKVRGTKRRKHFAHKVVTPTCTEETYLHKLAKQTFFDEYQTCLETGQPYNIELLHQKHCTAFAGLFGTPCIRTIVQTHDLTRYYDRISLEHRDGQFIPDVLLQSSKDSTRKLYIEVAVTHLSSDEKLHSGERIIEIDITCEEDISTLRSRHLTESTARFYNFEQKPIIGGTCFCASERYYCLMVYTNGKSRLRTATLTELDALLQRTDNLMHYELLPVRGDESWWYRGLVFVNLVKEAFQKGVAVRNCFVCHHAESRGSRYNKSPIYCKLYRKRCGSNEAATCKSFRDEHSIEERSGFRW